MSMLIRIALVLAVSCSSMAAVLQVDPSGAGGHTTINAALAAAVSGDVIQILPGTYPEYLEITKSVTLEAVAGRPSVVLDGLDANRIMDIAGPVCVRLSGLEFRRAHGVGPSALLIWNQAAVTVEDCAFLNNSTDGSNAVHVRHAGSSATFTGCDFIGNVCTEHSAALSLSFGASVVLDGCTIADNHSEGNSGAINTDGSHLDVRGCLFLRNSSLAGAGALLCENSTGTIENNTFYDNSGPGTGTVELRSYIAFSRNIVTGDRFGVGLWSWSDVGISANLYFDNALGAIMWSDLGPLDIQAEPQFCDAMADDFHLSATSPALAACGIIGAFGVGCDDRGPVPNEDQSWSDLKNSFR